MKTGISIWAFASTWSLEQCFNLTAESGIAGIELAYSLDGPIQPETTTAQMRTILQTARTAGVAITSLASGVFWKANLLSPDESLHQAALFHMRRMLELAADLEVDTILVVPGFTGPAERGPKVVQDYDAAFLRAVEDFRSLAPLAQKLGVSVGIENVWNRFLTSPYEMRSFLQQVDSPWIGTYLDVANGLRESYPEYWINLLGYSLKGVHLKDFRIATGNLTGFVDLLEGDVDFKAVAQALQEAAYSGWCVAEVEPHLIDPANSIRRAAQDLRLIQSF